MILFFSFLVIFSSLFSKDRVVAVVGNKPILESSVNEQVSAYMQVSGGNQNLDSLKKNILIFIVAIVFLGIKTAIAIIKKVGEKGYIKGLFNPAQPHLDSHRGPWGP